MSFRVAIVGMGIQGPKRLAAAGDDAVFTVDVAKPADYASIDDAPVDGYDAAILSVPDGAKLDLIRTLIDRRKHVLVEKPLLGTPRKLEDICRSANEAGVVVYVAYNHRFEPHFIKMRDALTAHRFGEIYRIRMFYGNGTARLVRDSVWRDRGAGVLPDLGSHLLDTIDFWFGARPTNFEIVAARRFENKAPDHVILLADGTPQIELEMSLVSWRNSFVSEVVGSAGAAAISGLCKWGPSTFETYERVLPSGRPPEQSETLVTQDPTWAAEHSHFRQLCATNTATDLTRDHWISDELARLSRAVPALTK